MVLYCHASDVSELERNLNDDSSKVNQRLGLLRRIKRLLLLNARLPFHNRFVLPILDYTDIVWGDKNNIVFACSGRLRLVQPLNSFDVMPMYCLVLIRAVSCGYLH